jgi:hypothetical protein
MPEVKISNGHLVFESRAGYDGLFNLPQKVRKSFLKELESSHEFTSLREAKAQHSSNQKNINGCNVPDSLIEDNEDFFATLDRDGVAQIGGDLLRLDYCNSKVFVISVSVAYQENNYTDFLTGNISNSNVGWFYTHVDVLDALSLSYRSMPDTTQINDPEGIFSQSKTGLFGITKTESKLIHDFDLEISPIDRIMDGKLAYDKFGFYFHFYAKEKYKYQSGTGLWLTATSASEGTDEWRVEYKFEYLKKGNGQTLQNGEATLYAPAVGGPNKIDKIFYSGSRGLKDGYALWTVWNNHTDYVKVHRNYVGEHFINIRSIPVAMPNYDLDVLDFNLAKPYFIAW